MRNAIIEGLCDRGHVQTCTLRNVRPGVVTSLATTLRTEPCSVRDDRGAFCCSPVTAHVLAVEDSDALRHVDTQPAFREVAPSSEAPDVHTRPTPVRVTPCRGEHPST